jgi:hypothetical protein
MTSHLVMTCLAAVTHEEEQGYKQSQQILTLDHQFQISVVDMTSHLHFYVSTQNTWDVLAIFSVTIFVLFFTNKTHQ